jgi:hypothetical protein
MVLEFFQDWDLIELALSLSHPVSNIRASLGVHLLKREIK